MYPCSYAMKAELGSPDRDITIAISETRGGYLFTYGGDYQNHGWYCQADGTPFPTVEAALAVANDPASKNVSEYETGVYGWSVEK